MNVKCTRLFRDVLVLKLSEVFYQFAITADESQNHCLTVLEMAAKIF